VGVLDIFKKDKEQNDEPELRQRKTYRICTENNPDKRNYRCSKRDIISPDCKLSVYLEELTSKDMREIEMEISNMLERHGFVMR
jgi:hypothetical protein